MTVENIVEIYRNCGFKFSKFQGNYYMHRGLIKYSFPTLMDIPINYLNSNILKWKFPLTIFKTNVKVKNAYEYILETSDYRIEKFSSKTRNQIRKSLKDCEFKKPPLSDLLKYGLIINKQTLGRQGRDDKFLTSKSRWHKYIKSFYNNDEVIFLGAYSHNILIAYIIVYEVNDKFTILHPFSDRNHSSSNPMNGLLFTLINELLNTRNYIKISYGLESVNLLPGLNKFKSSMLFQKMSTTRIFLINPLLLYIIKIFVCVIVKIFKFKNVQNSHLRRLISIYQGHRIFYKLGR